MDVASVLATGAEARKRTWYHEAVVAWRTGVLPTLPDGDTKRLVGNALVGRRSYENARQAYFAALSGDPTNEGLLVGLGQVCFELGDQVAAIELFRTASRLHPDSYRARAVLASALALLGQKEDAVAEYERCLAVAAEEAQALRGLAHLLLFDDPVRAAQLFARVRANDGHAAPRPGSPAPKAAPANVLRQVETVLASAQQLVNQGRFSEAVCLIEGALALDPTSTSARAALGITLRAQHSYVPATRLYRKLAAELPVTNWAHETLQSLEERCGEAERATAAARIALELSPQDKSRRVAYLWSRQFRTFLTADDVAERHAEWATGSTSEETTPALRRTLGPGDRLRVGYLSPDLRRHSVAFFLLPLLQHHDPARVEVTCYSCHEESDDVTAMLRASAGRWRDVSAMDDAAFAQLVRADGIDVLIDLAGQTAGSRVGLLSRRIAPIQATYLGYPNTSGLQAIDYRITSEFCDPPGAAEGLYTERLLRLPQSAWCFSPIHEEPLVPPPCLNRGYVTFGVVNAPSKWSSAFLMCCGEILRQVPHSRLLIVFRSIGCQASEAALRARLLSHGIAWSRVELRGWNPRPLAAFQEFDVALDTFPFNGHTMSCLGMWMGVPHVALLGDVNISRVGSDLLRQTQYPELIATTLPAYIQHAVDLAKDPPRLTAIRQQLRRRMQAAPLGNAKVVARALEDALLATWASHGIDPSRDAPRLPPAPPEGRVVALADRARVVVPRHRAELFDDLYVEGLAGDPVRAVVATRATHETVVLDYGGRCGADALALGVLTRATVVAHADEFRERKALQASIQRSRSDVQLAEDWLVVAGQATVIFAEHPAVVFAQRSGDGPLLVVGQADPGEAKRLAARGLIGLAAAPLVEAFVVSDAPLGTRCAWCTAGDLDALVAAGWVVRPQAGDYGAAPPNEAALERLGVFGVAAICRESSAVGVAVSQWAQQLLASPASLAPPRLHSALAALDALQADSSLPAPARLSLLARIGLSLGDRSAVAWLVSLEHLLQADEAVTVGALVAPEEGPVWGVALQRRLLASVVEALDRLGRDTDHTARTERLSRAAALGVPSSRMERALEVSVYRENLRRRPKSRAKA